MERHIPRTRASSAKSRLQYSGIAMIVAAPLLVGGFGCGFEIADPDPVGGTNEVEGLEAALVGGLQEPQHRHPWVVTVSSSLTCQGVLIHPSWVLTAAHCIGNLPASVSYRRTDATTGVAATERRDTALNAPKRGMYPHPDYQPGGGFSAPRNDIALLKLANPFTMNRHLQTVGLPRSPAVTGRMGTIANFSHNASLPTGYAAILRAPILGPAECAISPGSLCIRAPDASMCLGDSGSGFVMNLDGRATVVGIASYAETSGDCSDVVGTTGGLTDVYPHLPWILETMAMSVNQIAGLARLRWAGRATAGSMSIRCDDNVSATQRTALMDVPGSELAVYCPDSSVTVTCIAASEKLPLTDFSVRTTQPNGSATTQSLPYLRGSTMYTADPTPLRQDFTCTVSDPKKVTTPTPVGVATTAR